MSFSVAPLQNIKEKEVNIEPYIVYMCAWLSFFVIKAVTHYNWNCQHFPLEIVVKIFSSYKTVEKIVVVVEKIAVSLYER